MVRLIPAAAVAALILELGAAATAMPLRAPEAASTSPALLAAAKKLGVIPANCTMDPFKKVYVCCSTDASGQPVCTEHPLDTDWPLQQRFQLQQVKPAPSQSQPLLLQPGPSQ
jgi:hypothetical protein